MTTPSTRLPIRVNPRGQYLTKATGPVSKRSSEESRFVRQSRNPSTIPLTTAVNRPVRTGSDDRHLGNVKLLLSEAEQNKLRELPHTLELAQQRFDQLESNITTLHNHFESMYMNLAGQQQKMEFDVKTIRQDLTSGRTMDQSFGLEDILSLEIKTRRKREASIQRSLDDLENRLLDLSVSSRGSKQVVLTEVDTAEQLKEISDMHQRQIDELSEKCKLVHNEVLRLQLKLADGDVKSPDSITANTKSADDIKRVAQALLNVKLTFALKLEVLERKFRDSYAALESELEELKRSSRQSNESSLTVD